MKQIKKDLITVIYHRQAVDLNLHCQTTNQIN